MKKNILLIFAVCLLLKGYCDDVVCYSFGKFNFSPSVFLRKDGIAIKNSRQGDESIGVIVATKNDLDDVSELKNKLNQSLFRELADIDFGERIPQSAAPPISGIVPGSGLLMVSQGKAIYVSLCTNHENEFWIGFLTYKPITEILVNDIEISTFERTSGWKYTDIDEELIGFYRTWIDERERKQAGPREGRDERGMPESFD